MAATAFSLMPPLADHCIHFKINVIEMSELIYRENSGQWAVGSGQWAVVRARHAVPCIFIPGGAKTRRHGNLSWKCGRLRMRPSLAERAQRAPVLAITARCSSLAGKVRRVFWRMPEMLVWMCRDSLGWTN